MKHASNKAKGLTQTKIQISKTLLTLFAIHAYYIIFSTILFYIPEHRVGAIEVLEVLTQPVFLVGSILSVLIPFLFALNLKNLEKY